MIMWILYALAAMGLVSFLYRMGLRHMAKKMERE